MPDPVPLSSAGATARLLCLWFPDWATQRYIRAEGLPCQTPVALFTTHATRGQLVHRCNHAARLAGIHRGMPVSEAASRAEVLLRRRSGSLQVAPSQPDQDRRALQELCETYVAFSPCLGVEQQEEPECLWLDITGVPHLFGGEGPLVQQLQQRIARQGLQARMAIAPSLGAAWALAHFVATDARPARLSAAELPRLQTLPIEALRLTESTRDLLLKLGVQKIGQLQQLERAAVLSRLGPEPLTQLDRLAGQAAEWIVPQPPRPRYVQSISLEHPVRQRHLIDQIVRTLLWRLLDQLRPQQLGILELAGRFCFERPASSGSHTSEAVADRPTWTWQLVLYRPSDDREHVWELLQLQLDSLPGEQNVVTFVLEAVRTTRLVAEQGELMTGGSRPAELRHWSRLIDRLTSRLGPQAVTHRWVTPDAHPERAHGERPAMEQASAGQPPAEHPVPRSKGSASGASDVLTHRPLERPLSLWKQPVQIGVTLHVEHGLPEWVQVSQDRQQVVHVEGPERIETGWWHSGAARRNYYRVQVASGARWWIFQRLTDKRWFLHGELA